MEKISTYSFTDTVAAVDKITDLLIGHSLPLAETHVEPCKKNKCAIMSNFQLMLKLLIPNAKLHLILGKTMNILVTIKYTTFTIQNIRTIEPTKSKN